MFDKIMMALKKAGKPTGDFFANNPQMLQALESFGGGNPNDPIGQALSGISSGIRMGLAGRARGAYKEMANKGKNAPVATQDNSAAPGADMLTPPPGYQPPTDDGNWEMDEQQQWKRKSGAIPLMY